MTSDRVSLEKVHSIVGHVCVLWAEIDYHLMNILYLLAQYSSSHYRLDRVAAPFDTLLRNMDMRQKCEAAVFLFHNVTEDNSIYEDARKLLLNDVSQTLRNLRNRIIHDDWVPGEESVSRMYYRTKIERPQARQRVQSVREEVQYTTSNELEQIAGQFIEATDEVAALFWRLNGIVKMRRLTKSDQQNVLKESPSGGG